ncbi:hypothetical protein EMCRGX_G010139 [Ephydatia muelleri]
MQDKIDDLQLSSDENNDTQQVVELHEDSDASMKDSETLMVSASNLISSQEEQDSSIKSCDSEPTVGVMKHIE